MRTLYAMSTSRSSKHYTPHAIHSFFLHTVMREGDAFLLIDNDGDFDDVWLRTNFPQVNFFRRKKPASFAQNANFSIMQAAKLQADVFFMNNDIIYTPRWNLPLLTDLPLVMTPTCNQNYCYKGPKLELKPTMVLEEYLGKEQEFLSLVAQHLSSPHDIVPAYKTNFYCVKIPLSVYRYVGGFDTQFRVAGGEDDDYSVRAHLLGFGVASADNSYLLHFGGRSTWSGLESREEWLARERRFISQFENKWGPTLARFLLTRDRSVVDDDPELRQTEAAHGVPALLKRMVELDGKQLPPLQSPIDPGFPVQA